MRILVTGVAGFIGFHTALALLGRGHALVGLDNLNDYYDVRLKTARLTQLLEHPQFHFHKVDVADRVHMEEVFKDAAPERVIHLAAQAGVRYSITHPHSYAASNLTGMLHVLEGCRHHGVEHLVFASSSSVYGANRRMPFRESDPVNHPVSLYAATKKSNELMAHTYAALYGLPTTGLRFFTVYGPWGRPDMAYFRFTEKIFAGEPIDVYNHGVHERDFTYVDDIVSGVVDLLDIVPEPDPDWVAEHPDPASSFAPYRIYNIGNNRPVSLAYFIERLEFEIGKPAKKNYLPMQPGDVKATYADIDRLAGVTGFRPTVSIEDGLSRFVNWYRQHYGV